jgi:hypothetical protein
MIRVLLALAILALLALAWGCGSDNVTAPTPGSASLLYAPNLSQDTSDARRFHIVRLQFYWETDRASTDVLLYGPAPDSLRDSVVAENVDLSRLDGSVSHLHQAPSSSVARLQLPTARKFYFQVRMHSKESGAPLSYAGPYPLWTMDPGNFGRPGGIVPTGRLTTR